MKKQRAQIHNLNDPSMPLVTEMIATDITAVESTLVHFLHPDETATIINLAPGWSISVTPHEEAE